MPVIPVQSKEKVMGFMGLVSFFLNGGAVPWGNKCSFLIFVGIIKTNEKFF